jgi:hypothetical protein
MRHTYTAAGGLQLLRDLSAYRGLVRSLHDADADRCNGQTDRQSQTDSAVALGRSTDAPSERSSNRRVERGGALTAGAHRWGSGGRGGLICAGSAAGGSSDHASAQQDTDGRGMRRAAIRVQSPGGWAWTGGICRGDGSAAGKWRSCGRRAPSSSSRPPTCAPSSTRAPSAAGAPPPQPPPAPDSASRRIMGSSLTRPLCSTRASQLIPASNRRRPGHPRRPVCRPGPSRARYLPGCPRSAPNSMDAATAGAKLHATRPRHSI